MTHYLQTLPVVFEAAFNAARDVDPKIADATSPFSHVDSTRYYLADGKASGFAVRPDGELVFVFSLVKGRGRTLIAYAIRHGATHLDCFDGYLTRFYFDNGFDRVTSLPNWTPDGPDVVFMALPGHYLSALGKAEALV